MERKIETKTEPDNDPVQQYDILKAMFERESKVWSTSRKLANTVFGHDARVRVYETDKKLERVLTATLDLQLLGLEHE